MAEDLKGGTSDKFKWAEANEACPSGWSLPSKEDFETLVAVDDFEDEWSDGRWWGEGRTETSAYVLVTESGEVPIISPTGNKVTPESVRCIKD